MAAQEDTRIDVSVEKLMGVAEKVRRITGPAKQQWMNLRHNESCVSIEKLFDDMENVVKSAKKETQRQQVSINQKMNELQEERQTLKDELEKLKMNNKKLELENRQYQNDMMSLRSKVDSRIKVIRTFEERWSILGETNTVFDKKLKERYGENSSLKKKNKKLTEDNKRYSIELMELKALRTANHQLEQRLSQLEIDKARLLQNFLQEKSRERGRINPKIYELCNEMDWNGFYPIIRRALSK